MGSAEYYLIFALLPMYLLACIGLVHLPVFDKASGIAIYIVNAIIWLVFGGWYAQATGIAGGEWLMGSVFAAPFAALLATAAALEVRTRSLWKLPRGVAPSADYPVDDFGKWIP